MVLPNLVKPVASNEYGMGFGRQLHPFTNQELFHEGLDLQAEMEAPVVAVAAGRVVQAEYDADGYGNFVVIDHGHGLFSLYGHMDELLVEADTTVASGSLLGRVGRTGLATGPHLHFGLRQGTSWIDPLPFFPGLSPSRYDGAQDE